VSSCLRGRDCHHPRPIKPTAIVKTIRITVIMVFPLSCWRRLNLIITRAKRRVEVFTSIKSTGIKLTPGSKRGVDALKTFLEYAEKGILANYGEITITKEPDSDFEIAVSKVLISHGYEAVPQVGVAVFLLISE